MGEVNGATLNAKNVAEEILANVMKFRVIDTTAEMAHARSEKREAKKALDENDIPEIMATLQGNYERWNDEVARLENEPGNCKRIAEIVSESAFVRAVEIVLGDAILKQSLKSAEDVAAEEEAKRQARRAATKAKRAAKKAAQANA